MLRALTAICLICFGAMCIALAGCGETPPRAAASGSITLDGNPLSTGSILFTPLGGGPSAGGQIVDGRYALPVAAGPGPGKYRVTVNAWSVSGPPIYDEATGVTRQEPTSIIPARYNSQSELEVEVQNGADNTFDFPLTSY